MCKQTLAIPGVTGIKRLRGGFPGQAGTALGCLLAASALARPAPVDEWNPREATLALTIGIAPESAAAQDGIVGRVASRPLRVVVREAGSNKPVDGIPVLFERMKGTGDLIEAPGFSTVTDARGVVSLRFVHGTGPFEGEVVTEQIRASILMNAAAKPVLFDLTARRPCVDLIAVQPAPPGADSPSHVVLRRKCGTGRAAMAAPPFDGLPSTRPAQALDARFPLDASDKLVGVLLTDGAGRPVPNVAVHPALIGFDGQPVSAEGVVRFLPSRAVTDAKGRACFAVVLLSTAPPAKLLRIRYELQAFDSGDAAHTPLGCEWMLAVLDPTARRAPDRKPIRPIRAMAGQGAVAIPGDAKGTVLDVAFQVGIGNETEMAFRTTQPGDVLEPVWAGRSSSETDAATGLQTLKAAAQAGRIAVRLKPGPVPLPRVVTADGNETGPLVFAVGPPEVRLVRKAFQRDERGRIVRDASGDPVPKAEGAPLEPIGGPGSPDPFVRDSLALSFGRPAQADPAAEFMIEAWLPDVGPVAEARLDSLDEAGALLDSEGAYARTSIPVPLNRQEGVGGMFFRYLSGPILMISARFDPEDESPAPLKAMPDGRLLIQGGGGSLRPILLLDPKPDSPDRSRPAEDAH